MGKRDRDGFDSASGTGRHLLDRYLLLYLHQQQGHQTIRQIGERFDLIYFSVGRRISMLKEQILPENRVKMKPNYTNQ